MRRTPLGSLICTVKQESPEKPHVVLEAHIDEIGLMVCAIDEEGFLKVTRCGGIDRRVLCGKPVTVGDMQINCTSLMYGELPVSAVLDGDTNEPTEG